MKKVVLLLAVVSLGLSPFAFAESPKTHRKSEPHKHSHKKNCGHKAEVHGDHTDYEHDGHHHKKHGNHVDECDGPEAEQKMGKAPEASPSSAASE